jgi:hypothetical protein
MAEYIDRVELKKKAVYSYDRHECVVPLSVINWQPVAEVVQQRRGHWERGGFFASLFGLAKCSECGDLNEKTYYCPFCGARMDEERSRQ